MMNGTQPVVTYVPHKLVGKSGCLPFPGCTLHLEPVVLKKIAASQS